MMLIAGHLAACSNNMSRMSPHQMAFLSRGKAGSIATWRPRSKLRKRSECLTSGLCNAERHIFAVQHATQVLSL